MNLDKLRDYCLSFLGATENVQWGNDLVFKIGGKMFTVACLDPAEAKLSFKCTPEESAELIEQDGIKPADYVAPTIGSRCCTGTRCLIERSGAS